MKTRTKKHQSLIISLIILFAVFLGYVSLTWMNVINPLSDWGRWHHEVDRFTSGEIPYKDFTWQYPPLSIYILGTIANIFGSNFFTMQIFNVIICGIITVLAWLITRKVLFKYVNSDSIVLLICVGSLLSGYTTLIVYTFSSGDYTPAIPIGTMFALLLLYGTLQVLNTQSRFYFALSGLATAGCLLTKQEFWIFSLSMGIFMSLILYLKNKPKGKLDKKGILLYWLLGLGITLLGYGLVIRDAGMVNLLTGLSGFTDLRTIGRMMPSIRLMLDQVVMSSFYIVLFVLIFNFAGNLNKKIRRKLNLIGFIVFLIGIISFGIITFQTYNIANTIALSDIDLKHGTTATLSSWGFITLKSGINIIADWDLQPTSVEFVRATLGSVFLNTIIKHLLPGIALILCAFIYLWYFRKKIRIANTSSLMIATLALAVLTLQIRRLFERTEASLYFIAPIFIFLLVINLTSKIKFNHRRFITVLAIIWFLIGGLFFTIKTIAPRITYSSYELNTTKGSLIVFSEVNIQPVIDTINNITKPDDYLLSLPYDCGLNYMTNRRNPIRVTQFYLFSLSKQEELDIIQELIQKQPLIVIDEKMFVYAEFPQPSLSKIFDWEPERNIVTWRGVYPDLWEFIEANYQCTDQIHPDWSICEMK